MKSKIIAVLMIFTLIMSMAACSQKSHTGSGSSSAEPSSASTQESEADRKAGKTDSQPPVDPLSAEELTMGYFEWDVREKIIEKALSYVLTLRNKSPYPLLLTEITYKTRDNVSERSLALFDEFKTAHKKYIKQDEDNRNIILIGRSEAYVKSGQYLKDVPVTIGIHSMTWYDSPDYDQFILMRPDTLSLGLVKDDLLYYCHYDFTAKSWSVDETPVKLNVWPDTELTRLIPKPSCDYFQIKTKKDDDYLGFTVYGYSREDYQKYVESVKESGFTKNRDSGKRYYSAEDRHDNSIDIIYDKTNWNMDVSLNL